MTDMIELAAEIVRASSNAPIRLRQGVISSVNANGTANVTVAGSTIVLTDIKVASHVCPVPNTTVFLATDGRDWFVLSSLAPNGHAWGAMRQSAAQSIPNATFTDLSWSNRTDTIANGVTLGNTGITIVVPGLYHVTATVVFTANSTGQRHARLNVNGGVVIQGTGGNAAAGSDVTRLRADGLLRLSVGDVINVDAYQSSTGALNTNTGAGANMLRAVWISPAS